MTKKELQERISSVRLTCNELWIEVDAIRNKNTILEAHLKAQLEINNLLAKQLGGKLVEEDYVKYNRQDGSKEVDTRWAFKKVEIVSVGGLLDKLKEISDYETPKPKRKHTKRKKK